MEITVNLYLWIGLIVGLVFSVVYINNLLNRMKKMELVFIQSMAAVSEDVLAIDKRIEDLKFNQDTVTTFLDEKYGNKNK